ncbi:MAG: hypothetical protein JW749_04430 [Sedimentisphaerales bacterium]|nr:hypothetical protein [Sedimentisphaerales bacterium]
MDSRPNTKNERRATSDERRFHGSAIILAIVLTTLLAIVAVMFLLSSRIDMLGTSAIADNKNLNLAVDSVIAKISQELAADVPGIDPNSEYYDYPDGNDAWLACLEPYQSGAYYFWRQGSNIYNDPFLLSRNIRARVLDDYNNFVIPYTAADADGDGVSDANWIQIPGMTSSKGKSIYAAIRVVDNGGMLNVNTGYKFDANTSDGSAQLNVNIMSLSWRPPGTYAAAEETDLRVVRSPVYQSELQLPVYEQGVIWKYGTPDGNFTPFDVSDELEMRYRFVLNHKDIDTRLENWGGEFRNAVESTPYSSVAEWFFSAYDFGVLDPNYAYRHIATTYNFDRIIDPNGDKMLNINMPFDVNINNTYATVRRALDPGISDAVTSQITANLIDYIDGSGYIESDPRYDPNNDVTVVYDTNGTPHFGFEQPCVYISEIAQKFVHLTSPNDVNVRSYAIELQKPYWEDDFPADPNHGWQLLVDGNVIPINWTGSRRFHVIENINALAPIIIDFTDVNGPNDINQPTDPCAQPHPYVAFSANSIIILQRRIPEIDANITVDWVSVPEPNDSLGWLIDLDVNDIRSGVYSYQRDIWPHKHLRRFWGLSASPSVGNSIAITDFRATGSPFVDSQIQAHPANKPFTNVGQFEELFYRSTYDYGELIPSGLIEEDLRINLTDPNYQRVFNYLTVFDPTTDGIDNDGDGVGTGFEVDANELKVKGRININTAPWFVLAQLPWLSYHTPNYDLARAIANYRDTVAGFESIGELMRVTDSNNLLSMDFYSRDGDGNDLSAFPDLTPADEAANDFEERDVIFARISNLVTVRSDVFTAYILVRIGQDGPQKRVVAILDRSETPAKPVKVIAIQSVPDPR